MQTRYNEIFTRHFSMRISYFFICLAATVAAKRDKRMIRRKNKQTWTQLEYHTNKTHFIHSYGASAICVVVDANFEAKKCICYLHRRWFIVHTTDQTNMQLQYLNCIDDNVCIYVNNTIGAAYLSAFHTCKRKTVEKLRWLERENEFYSKINEKTAKSVYSRLFRLTPVPILVIRSCFIGSLLARISLALPGCSSGHSETLWTIDMIWKIFNSMEINYHRQCSEQCHACSHRL